MSERRPVDPDHLRAVRVGHGANCSSVGSVIDTLFAAALVGGAVYAAIMAALAEESIQVTTPRGPAVDASGREVP